MNKMNIGQRASAAKRLQYDMEEARYCWKAPQTNACFADVHEAFDHVLDEIEDAYHTKVDYPVAEFVIVFGFFVVLILEQIVLDCKEGWQQVSTR